MATEAPVTVLDGYLSLGIAFLCAWLVPHVAMEIAKVRHRAVSSFNGNDAERIDAALWRAAVVAIVSEGILWSASAAGVALATQELDWRVRAIVTGLSRLTAAVILFLFSYRIPRWIGVYWSSDQNDDCGGPLGATEKQLLFQLQWSMWRRFGQIYCFSLLFFCGATPIKIPVSAVGGIVLGLVIWYLVYLGRTKWHRKQTWVAIGLASLLSVASALVFSSGCWYIQQVWGRNQQDNVRVRLGSFLVWLVLSGFIHVMLYTNTIRKDKYMATLPLEQQIGRKYKTWYFDPYQIRNLRNDIQQSNNSVEESGQITELDGNCNEKDMEESDREKEAGNTGNDSKSGVERSNIVNAASTDASIEEKNNESWFSLVRLQCCRKRPRTTRLERILSFFRWTIWVLVNAFVLFLVIINIGATHQNKVVQKNLPLAYASLYPTDYNNGTVCAWDNKGPESIIQTFATPNDAVAANFSIVHCGACGACSTWNDLRLQWTTRSYLAGAAQNCAKKSLLGGIDAVQECNEHSIGFSKECATCWTADELCARDNCVFIFFQQVLTNRYSNFQVGPMEITSATCDEAMCGRAFVPCSGATRRRMDIVSTIARPGNQQCNILDQDWATVFDHP